jgi:soluble lytic murein transglycosylase-like protein
MADPLAPYDPIFQAAGAEWNVDPLLLKSIAKQESGGNSRAVSPAGAQGLMQIMPDTAKGLGVTDPFDPVQSIWGAAKYMDEALRVEGSPENALLYYHGGPGWRQAYGKESQGYVPAVTGHYKALLAAQPPPQAATPQQAAAAPQAPQEPR